MAGGTQVLVPGREEAALSSEDGTIRQLGSISDPSLPSPYAPTISNKCLSKHPPPPPKDPPPYHPRDLIIPAHAAPNKFGAGGSLGNLNGPQSHGHVNGVQSAPLPPSFPSTNAQGQRICRRRSANMWKNGDRGLGGDHVCCKKVERVERRRKLARQPLAAQTANAVGATHNAEQTPPGKMSRSHAPPPPPPIPPPPPPPVDDNEADDILAAESGCPSPPPDPVPPLEDLVSTHSGGGDALLLPFNDPLRPPS
ncbi:hypothetical protein PC9H_009015 [Pleurotus ostreatus]|uniref:Uncharacterized protein n=1 Tax=Pleurotus ostreatus TaxID=5322 RepID=A0A8H7DTN4_PLEOS|nr:uncharacterized protein PC9H_009015 [Pleurotus ostreatus]KAF7426646.1 hypothetical protein PC9H_009015 [Pleurotus ostreatus]